MGGKREKTEQSALKDAPSGSSPRENTPSATADAVPTRKSRRGSSPLLPIHPEKKPDAHEHQDGDETTPEAPPRRMHPYALLLCGGILELLYLLIVALAPLPGLHLSSTPLAAAWPWTLLPSRILFPGAWASPGYDWMHVVLLSATLI